MVRYTLLGTPIAFDDGAERFFDLQYRSWTAQDRAFEEFSKWYKKYDNIEAILSKYRQFSKELIEKHAVKPLFSTLTTSSIFDVSKESYYRTCLDLSPVDEALQSVSSKYQQIEQTQAAQERYRQVRKASRGRWQGGGFGLSGALKGAAQAGALNMVSGLGHSMVNAVGNAGSAVAASSSKQALFKNQATFNLLFQGIELSIYSAYEAHMELLNSRKGSGYIRSQFDFDRSSALFENAKKLPNRKEELLTQAVLFCPWNYELIKYLFLEYPMERKDVCAIAKRFHVDLSALYETIFAQEYTEEAHESEASAQAARDRIIKLMEEFSVTESSTLNQLEHDRLGIICTGIEQADEIQCNKLKEQVESYKALDKNKAPFLDKIQARIQEIWSQEDGEVFNALYEKTDLFSPEDVKAAQTYIEQHGRTDDAKQYLTALESCTPKNIRAAKLYQHKSRPRLFRILLLFSFSMFVCNLVLFHAGILVGISFLALWICFLLKRSSLSDAWNKLTVKGRVLHPAITAELSPAEKRLTPSTWVLLALLAAVCVLTAYNVISSTTLDKSAPLESDTSQTLESDISQPLHEEETSAPEQAESPVYDTSAYYNILGGYYIVLMDGYSASMLEENNFNALCAYYDASQVGYAIQDVDGNGVPELLIGEIGEAGGGSGAFFDLYTLVDGQAVLVAASSERDRYYICQDGTIANEGSFGADDSYNAYYTIDPTTGTCSILEAVVYQGFYENAGPWFYTTLVPWEASVYDGSQTEISEAEAAQIMQNHSYKAIEFQAIPAM